ncbi:MAG: hypothetical protein PVF83_09750 [Anaerolineales bacterium]|jgi:hypothetical protein
MGSNIAAAGFLNRLGKRMMLTLCDGWSAVNFEVLIMRRIDP